MPELAYNLPSAWSAQGCGLTWPQAWRRSGVSFLLELAAGPGAGWGGSLTARGSTDAHLTQSSVVLWVGTTNQHIWLLNRGVGGEQRCPQEGGEQGGICALEVQGNCPREAMNSSFRLGHFPRRSGHGLRVVVQDPGISWRLLPSLLTASHLVL